MKTANLKPIAILLLSAIFQSSITAQKGIEDGSKYGHGNDSINCRRNISIYDEYFKNDSYLDAIGSWRKVFNNCPASSEKMYIDGVKMFKSFIADELDSGVARAYLDTIMLIYDRRMEYFGETAREQCNILSRKAKDLMDINRIRFDDNILAIEEAYGWLEKALELDPDGIGSVYIMYLINSSTTLFRTEMIKQEQAITDYFKVSEIVDIQLSKHSSSRRWLKAKETIDKLIFDAGILTCEALDNYYEPEFDANMNDVDFLKKLISLYYTNACDRLDMYVKASEKLYELEPTPESAYNLAHQLYFKKEYDKAIYYYKEAVTADVDPDTKSRYYYELALVVSENGEVCQGIEYTREAINNNPNFGEAYILLGDLYIQAIPSLGKEDFNKKTAYWAATDKYIKAKNTDASLSEKANERLENFSGQYPTTEDVFFRTLKEGDPYRVEGCINENTTIRCRVE